MPARVISNWNLVAQYQLPQISDATAQIMAAEVQEILRRADAVCFDVDSTVIQEEGIDELAKFCGKGAEVANL